MATINEQILERIKNMDDEAVFVSSDFTDIADINTVRQILSRQEQAGEIQRVIRGIYYCPQYSDLLGEYEAPSPHHAAMAIARKFGWTIAPSGNTALNQLGLSTQVPAKWSYISDGPYKRFEFGRVELEYRHRSNRDISGLSYKTALVIQAIRALGKENISSTEIEKISACLSEKEKEKLLTEEKQSTAWIYKYMKEICGKEK